MSGDRRAVYNPLCLHETPIPDDAPASLRGDASGGRRPHYGDMRTGAAATERPVVPVEQETAVDLCHEMRRSDVAPHAAPGLR
jgi:hypothetical protein